MIPERESSGSSCRSTVHAALGIDRVVFTQPSVYGTGNSFPGKEHRLPNHCFILSAAFRKRSVRPQASAAASLSKLPRSNECSADGYKRNS